MVTAARGRGIDPDRFEVVAGDMATARAASLPPGGADLTMAMGSLQYCVDPAAGLARLAELTRPGGIVLVLVDSRLALVLELLAAGKDGEAVERARTGRGVWRLDGKEAGLHLFDAAGLLALCAGAGLADLTVRGLLVGASAFGRDGLAARLTDDYDAALARERQLAATPGVADTGKQLLARGRKP